MTAGLCRFSVPLLLRPQYWWGVGGFVAGLVVLEAGQLLWLHFFG